MRDLLFRLLIGTRLGRWIGLSSPSGARRRCPHSNLRGIYGDEVNRTPGGCRLECLDCGALLRGSVMLALLRAGETELSR